MHRLPYTLCLWSLQFLNTCFFLGFFCFGLHFLKETNMIIHFTSRLPVKSTFIFYRTFHKLPTDKPFCGSYMKIDISFASFITNKYSLDSLHWKFHTCLEIYTFFSLRKLLICIFNDSCCSMWKLEKLMSFVYMKGNVISSINFPLQPRMTMAS